MKYLIEKIPRYGRTIGVFENQIDPYYIDLNIPRYINLKFGAGGRLIESMNWHIKDAIQDN